MSWNSPQQNGYTFDWVVVWRGSTKITQYYVPHHGSGGTALTVKLDKADFLGTTSGSYLFEVYACDQNQNPWFGGCLFTGGLNKILLY